jgi:hypothetical protein
MAKKATKSAAVPKAKKEGKKAEAKKPEGIAGKIKRVFCRK